MEKYDEMYIKIIIWRLNKERKKVNDIKNERRINNGDDWLIIWFMKYKFL